jgi:uncharacterized protein with HEPN domain
MRLKLKAHLIDIIEAINDIDTFIGEKRLFEQFVNNNLISSAVERKFEIIGEAMNCIKRDAPELVIENQKAIINFRNRVIHAYDSIDKEVIWAIIINHLPKLRTEVERMLQNLNNEKG